MSTFDPADREQARTDSDAKHRFLSVLNKSLSTVSSAIWVVGTTDSSLTAFTTPPAVKLRCRSGSALFLRSTIRFEYVADNRFSPVERKVSTKYYAHTVGTSDCLSPQLYSWEWSTTETPHLHVHRGDPEFRGLGKLHIPTGRVYFEDVLRFLLAEHEVVPKRSDWEEVIARNLRRVSGFATWGAAPDPP